MHSNGLVRPGREQICSPCTRPNSCELGSQISKMRRAGFAAPAFGRRSVPGGASGSSAPGTAAKRALETRCARASRLIPAVTERRRSGPALRAATAWAAASPLDFSRPCGARGRGGARGRDGCAGGGSPRLVVARSASLILWVLTMRGAIFTANFCAGFGRLGRLIVVRNRADPESTLSPSRAPHPGRRPRGRRDGNRVKARVVEPPRVFGPKERGAMQIFVKTLTGKTITLEARAARRPTQPPPFRACAAAGLRVSSSLSAETQRAAWRPHPCLPAPPPPPSAPVPPPPPPPPAGRV